MKKVFVAFLLAFLCANAFPQARLSDTQSRAVMETLTQTAAAMQTMQCRFVQENTSSMLAEPSISEGLMYFASPDKMRWEYTKPYAFALIVNGERLVKETDGQTEPLEGNSNRMYKGMASLIMDSASGKKLFDTSSFDVALFDEDNFWKAKMTPKRRDMKRMFSQLVFAFNKATQGISRVEFISPDGAVTTIRFEDIVVNETIDETVFEK